MSSELYGGQDPVALTECRCLFVRPDDVTVVKDPDGRVVGYVVRVPLRQRVPSGAKD